jgi:(+)-pinoresinol hydroxylase
MKNVVMITCALLCGVAGNLLLTTPARADGDPVKGKAVFMRWCWGCHEPLPGHGIDPPAGTHTLQDRYKGALPAAIEERTDLKPDYIRTLVRHGVNIMPPLRKTEVTDQDLDDVIAYLTAPKKP